MPQSGACGLDEPYRREVRQPPAAEWTRGDAPEGDLYRGAPVGVSSAGQPANRMPRNKAARALMPVSTAGAPTMKAIDQDEYGTAPEAVLRLAEVARPAIADDEILVRVRAASVDRGTWHLMAGLAYPMRLVGFGLRARPRPPTQAAVWRDGRVRRQERDRV